MKKNILVEYAIKEEALRSALEKELFDLAKELHSQIPESCHTIRDHLWESADRLHIDLLHLIAGLKGRTDRQDSPEVIRKMNNKKRMNEIDFFSRTNTNRVIRILNKAWKGRLHLETSNTFALSEDADTARYDWGVRITLDQLNK